MKNVSKFFLVSCIAVCMSISASSIAQVKKYPDGTVIYPDGTRKLPNGTVIYKDKTLAKNSRISLPDGSVIYPDGSRRYSHTRRQSRRWLPPGQAKKIYGGSATDYAPGQQKKWKHNYNGKGNGEHKEHGKRGGRDHD
jgi:hypothetical protein